MLDFKPVGVPKFLYHATFAPLLKKIKAEGLGGASAKKMWSDSRKGVVYLAMSSDIALSYAETIFDDREDLPESWGENIIILKIDTDRIDKKKLRIDSNVIDNQGDTLEYHGIIPFEAIVKVIRND